MGGNALKKIESSLFVDSFFFQSWNKQSPQKVRTLFFPKHFPPCLGLSFFSELKCSDYFRTNFHLFAGARVLDTHLGYQKAACTASDQTKFHLSVGDGAT